MKMSEQSAEYEAGYMKGQEDAINNIKIDVIFPDPIAKYLAKRFPDPRTWVVINTYDAVGKIKELAK